MSSVDTSRPSIESAFRWRRGTRVIRWFCVVSLIIAAVAIVANNQESALRDSSFSTGWILMGSVVFLAAFNLRKKFPLIPLGNAQSWMKAHLLVGWCSLGFFAIHVKCQIPHGGQELLVFVLFVATATSGILGWLWTRTIPARISALDREVIFEAIPAQRRKLALTTRELVMESAETSDVLADFYLHDGFRFFEAPRGWRYKLRPRGSECRRLRREVNALQRFLPDRDRHRARRLSELIQAKDDLDFQHALQWKLKLWLFAHLALTYGLLLGGAFHGLVAMSFGGSVS